MPQWQRRGKWWAGLRSACQPFFHCDSLAACAPLMTAAAEKLTKRCLGNTASRSEGKQAPAENAAGQPFNLTDVLGAFTLEVVGSTAFGCEWCHQKLG